MAEREWVTGPDLDAEIERVIFGHTEGIGYYGPPLDPAIAWAHELSVRYDSKKQATEAYRVYYEARHRGEHPQGIAIPGEYDHFGLCYWRDGWGPVAVPEYSEDIESAWLVVERLRDIWTAATDRPPGRLSGEHERWMAKDFVPPFDDGVFFESLHRSADRRWPWALLYVTPLAICRAALLAFQAPEQ